MTMNSVSLFLALSGVEMPVVIIIAVLAIALGCVGGIFVGSQILQKQREKKIGTAEAVVDFKGGIRNITGIAQTESLVY